jgi:hypothetical protein
MLNGSAAHSSRHLLPGHRSQRVFPPVSASLFADLSPIEEAFSKLKAALRRTGARTQEALWEAIALALQTITAHDALGWFTHCGYLALEEQRTSSEEQPFTDQAF